jgi:hypothetical protein
MGPSANNIIAKAIDRMLKAIVLLNFICINILDELPEFFRFSSKE